MPRAILSKTCHILSYGYFLVLVSVAVRHLRVEHYNRGFNGLAALPELWIITPLSAVAIGFLLRFVVVRYLRRWSRGLLIPLTISNLSIVLVVASMSLRRKHGLWLEYGWFHEHNVYRAYGFLPLVAYLLLVVVAVTFILQELVTAPRAWWVYVLLHLPLLFFVMLLLMQLGVEKPFFIG